MSRVQLGLPLTVVARLSEEEKSQLVVQQCTLLQIEEFEADALLKMCGASGKVSKGFGLVYRYAGLVDEIRDTMSEVIQILATQTSTTKTQLLVFGSFHNDISLVFLKLIYLLSSWRRMQWVPRPILFDSEGMLLSMTMFLGKLVKYFAMMCVNQLNGPQKEQHSVSDDMYNNLQILIQCVRDPTTVDGLDMTKLLEWFREVMEIEYVIEEKWQEVLNGTLVYPWLAILCLPYEEIKQHGDLNNWFVRYFKQYTRISRAVEDVIFPLLERAKISGNMDQYADSLLCFRDAEKLQPFFKRSQTRSVAYLSAKNQMQLGSVCPMVFRSTWIPYILSGLNHLEATSTVSPNIVPHRSLYSHIAQPIPMQSLSPPHETVKSVAEPLHVNTTVAVDPIKSTVISSSPGMAVTTPHSLGLTPVHPVPSELTTDTFLKDKATRASSSMVEGSHHSDIDNVDKLEDVGMRKSMEAMVEEPPFLPAVSASNDTYKKGNVDSSASIKSNGSKHNVAPIDTAVIREQTERVEADKAHKQQREEISPHGSEGERTADILPITSSSNGPNSSSTQPLFSPNPSVPAIVVNAPDVVVVEEPPVVKQPVAVEPVESVPPSASKSITIEDTRVPLATSASTDVPIFSAPPNLSVQAVASDPSEPVEEPQLDSPPPNITSPPLDTTTKKARPTNKKTMIIKHVLSDDADDDDEEGEVVYLVRYDRHSSPDHNIINQIQQIQAAKKAGGASTSGSSSANILATPTASTPSNNPEEMSILRQTSKNNNLLEEEEHFHRPRMSSDPSHSHSQHHPILLAQHRYSSPSSTSYRAPVVHGSPSWSHQQHPSNHPRYETRARTYTDSYYSPPTSSASLLSSSTSTQRNWSAKNRLRGIDFSAQSLSTALRQIDEETQLQASASTPSLMPTENTAVSAAAVTLTMEAKERRIAARKIATWYMIVAPRRKLLRRLLVRDTILGVISDVIDRTFQVIHLRQRRRQQLMRQGAAAKIQKHFRKWRLKLAAEERARELEERREAAWEYLDIWRRCVMNGIRLFRWFRTVVRRKMQTSGTSDSVSLGEAAPSALTSPVASKRASMEMPFAVSPIKEESGNTTNTSADTTPVDESKERRRSRIKKLRVSIMQNFVISPSTGFRVAIGDVIEMYIEEYVMFHKFGGFRRHSAPPVPIIHRNISTRTLVDIVYDKDDKSLHMRSYESYALCIQLAYRAYRARYAVWRRRMERQSTQTIILFLIRCMGRRRRIRAELRRVSATKITKWFKGIRARMRLYDEVRCGLLLKLAWINYMHYKKLKSQLRRVDRPITILLHGLRNITKRALATDEIRIVVSVWWNPLLHIVGEADAEQMVQSKPPQYIYRSQVHRVTTEDDKPIPELAQNRRTLGTMVQRAGAFMNRISSSQNLRPRLTSAASSDGDGSKDNGATPAIKEEDDDASEISAPVERQTLRNRRSANIHSGAPPSASPTAFVRKGDKSNLAIAAAVGAAANRKRSSSGGSQDPPEHKGPVPASSSSPPPPAGTKTTTPATPAGTSGAPSVEAPTAVTSPSQQFNPKAAALLANRIRQRRQSLSQPNGQAPADDNASTATGGNTLGGTISASNAVGAAGGDNSSIGTGGGHSASSGHAPPSAAGGGLAAALAMRRQRLESNDDTSHNNNTLDEEDDSTSDNPGFGQASRLTPTAQNVMRNTLAFAFGLSAMAKKSTVRKKSKVVCNFEDETIRIPGCHGNSVIKFEVFDGEYVDLC